LSHLSDLLELIRRQIEFRPFSIRQRTKTVARSRKMTLPHPGRTLSKSNYYGRVLARIPPSVGITRVAF